MDNEDLHRWISEWQSEYCPGANITIRYGDLGDQFGRTHSEMHGQMKMSEITINNIFQTSPLTSKIVAWHEFAHAWDYFRTGSMGHYDKWIKRWFSRPQYVVAMVIAFPIYLYNYARR